MNDFFQYGLIRVCNNSYFNLYLYVPMINVHRAIKKNIRIAINARSVIQIDCGHFIKHISVRLFGFGFEVVIKK